MRSSTIIEDRAQIDGRRCITERHITDTGRVIDVSYLAEAAQNVRATMTARVTQIEAQLQAEADARAESILRDRAGQRVVRYVIDSLDAEVTTRLAITDAELAALRRSMA